jgi:phosphohistidine swiveling domain-containing protein
MIDNLEKNPLEILKDGQIVKVDADKGELNL